MGQQRRKNLARPVVSFGIEPILASPSSVVATLGGALLVTWPVPINLLGVPLTLTVNGLAAGAAIQQGEASIEFFFPLFVSEGGVVRLNSWDGALRGPNGEWSSSINLTLPPPNYNLAAQPAVVSLVATGASEMDVTWSEEVSILTPLTWTDDTAGPVFNFSVDGTNRIVSIQFEGVLVPGGQLTIPPLSGLFSIDQITPAAPGKFVHL